MSVLQDGWQYTDGQECPSSRMVIRIVISIGAGRALLRGYMSAVQARNQPTLSEEF